MNEHVSARASAKDFFLYLGMIAALYVSAVSILVITFQAVNSWFVDPLLYYTGANMGALRIAISALVIAFPLFIILSRAVYRDLTANSAKRELWIRRWLIYLTLFISGATLAVNGIVLINTFLEGELTGRFALKVLAVALVASAIFRYYLFDLRRDLSTTAPLVRQLGLGAAFGVLVALVVGVLIVGTPGNQRLVRFDERRINDLASIQWQIVEYWQAKGTLPTELSLLNDPLSGYSAPADPEGVPYEYRVTGELSFELCATFALASSAVRGGSDRQIPYYVYPETGAENNWEHEAGRACFERTIDPKKYPPRGATTDTGVSSLKPVPAGR